MPSITWEKIASIIGKSSYDSGINLINFKTGMGNLSATYTFAADVAEVEVDPEIGKINILDAVVAHDIGRPLNYVNAPSPFLPKQKEGSKEENISLLKEYLVGISKKDGFDSALPKG